MFHPLTISLIALLLIWCVAYYLLWQKNKRLLHEANTAKKREIELLNKQASEERDHLLDSFGYAFFLVNKSEQIVFGNAAAKSLLKGRKLGGRSIVEAFLDEQFAIAIKKSIRSGKPKSKKVVLRTNQTPLAGADEDSLSAWIVEASPHTGKDGRNYTCVVIRNVTPEHQAEQIRQDFVANASHELRTPMAIIKGYIENLLEDDMLEDPGISRRFLGVMQKHSDRISRIVDDMLAIAKLESGDEISLNKEPFLVQECLDDVADRLSSLVTKNKANLDITISPNSLTIYGDRFYWAQIFFNLIENALKENPSPGLQLTVSAEGNSDHTIFKICDSGKGIPSDALPFIFKRFYRVDKHHTNSEIKGTGLGLSIVKRAVEAHGGSITATSTPGIETTFTIILPN